MNCVLDVLKVENLFINLHNVQIDPIIEKRVFGHTVPDRSLVKEWLYYKQILNLHELCLGVLKVENLFMTLRNVQEETNKCMYNPRSQGKNNVL